MPGLLDGQEPHLPPGHPYAQALAAIQAGVAAGAALALAVAEDVADAVRAFLQAEDWPATRRVLEARQALLLRPEVEAAFEDLIRQARAAGQTRAVRMLELHLALLCDCKALGIDAAFARLEAGGGATPDP